MGDITSNLELYWNLNETSGSTAADSSGNGRTGTTVNSPTWGAGQVGNALTFVAASSQYVATAANLAFMSGASALTIAAWMKKTAAGDYLIAGEGSSGAAPGIAAEYWTDGQVYFQVDAISYGQLAFESTAWHHFAFVFDGAGSGNSGRMKIYLDGVDQTLSFSGTVPATTDSPTGPFEIGRWNYAGGPYYNGGSMDEVRVYSRALTAADVTDLYNFTGVNNGNLSSTLGALTLSATGTASIQGNLAVTLGSLTLSATGTELIQGNLAVTLGSLTLLADGTVSGGTISGNLSVTLGGLSLTATGTNDTPPTPPTPPTPGTGFAGNYTPPGIDDCRPRFGDSDNVLLRKILKLLRGDCNGA